MNLVTVLQYDCRDLNKSNRIPDDKQHSLAAALESGGSIIRSQKQSVSIEQWQRAEYKRLVSAGRAERKRKRARNKWRNSEGPVASVTALYRNISALFDSRDQQLSKISEEKAPISKAEKNLNNKIALFGGSFGLATVAALVNPALALLSLPVALYILKDVYMDSYKSLVEKRKFDVNILVSILTTLLIAQGHIFFCNLYLVLFLLNRKLLFKLKHNSSNNIVDVFKQRSRSAWLLSDGVETEVPIESLNSGDVVVVNAGETFPVDGLVTAGQATVDQRLLTGESRPVEKMAGDPVFALTTVLAGRLELQVEKSGDETAAAQIGHILNQTVDVKTDMQLWSEQVTDKTVLPTFLLAGITWPFLGPVSALVVLNSHFRYRLTIITSTNVLNFLNLAAQQGILIKDGRTLELLSSIDTVVFDKTGTLTHEQPHIGQIHLCTDEYGEDEVLRYAAAAEYKQTHPIAKAILDAADEQGLSLPAVDQAEYRVGYGVTVHIDNHIVRVGSIRFMEAEACQMNAQMAQVRAYCEEEGHSLVMVALDDQVIGAIELHATIRPEVGAIIKQLREELAVELYIISGDQEAPTKRLANELGISHYFAETLPEHKADIIGQLQAEGKSVCYIGDGINDSIALKKAEVSVSLSGASSVAIDSADVILMDGTLKNLVQIFNTAREFKHNMSLISAGVFAPCLINLGGAFLFHLTLLPSMILSGVSVVAGFGSAMWPLVKYQQNQAVPKNLASILSLELDTNSK